MQTRRLETAADRNRVITGDELRRFDRLYPERFGPLSHDLHRQALFQFDRLAAIADGIDAKHSECRSMTAGGEFAVDQDRSARAGDAIRTLDDERRWVMLRDIQDVPAFADLIATIADDIAPTVTNKTGPMQRLRAYLFISSPGMLTPLHFDPEYNVLFQIRGRKTFTAYPPRPPFLDLHAQEAYFGSGQNLLDHEQDRDAPGQVLLLVPGDACHVPFKAPHEVMVGDEPSVSLSLTWVSSTSLEHDDAWRCNAWLRRRGLDPRSPFEPPARNRGKALSYRALRRARLAD